MNNYQKMWLDLLGTPSWYKFEKQCNLIKRYSLDDIDLELYVQSNGPGTFQRIIMALPKKLTAPAPAVAVPFYFLEAMLGFDPETGEVLENFSHIAMTADLARRGVIAATAEAYHLTYTPKAEQESGFSPWQRSSGALLFNPWADACLPLGRVQTYTDFYGLVRTGTDSGGCFNSRHYRRVDARCGRCRACGRHLPPV